MNKIQTLMRIAAAFTLYILIAASTLIAAPSEEVTDRLTAELQNIRKNVAQEAIEIFEDKDLFSGEPWDQQTLCRQIIKEEKPVTQLDLLAGDIQKIINNIKETEANIARTSHRRLHIGPRINYTYSEMAERILRLQLYYNRFAHSAIPYIEASNPYHCLITDLRNILNKYDSDERFFITTQTRTIAKLRLEHQEINLASKMLQFSALSCIPPNNQTPTTPASAPAAGSHKRTLLDASDSDDIVTNDLKRVHIDENDDDDDDPEAAQPAAQSTPKNPGFLPLLHSHAHDTNAIHKRSNIMAHEGFRDHFLKTESQAIARTMIDQADKLSMLNVLVFANTESEQYSLVDIPSYLRAYQQEKRSILHSPEIKQDAPCMISIAQEISENVSNLEANHVKPYAQNLKRIKQWQQHYQNVLNMGLLYLKGITVEDPEHIALRDRLRNRFAQDLGVDIIPTLPPENQESTDIQKIMDLQRITLANKTTRALAGIQKMQSMLNAEDDDDDDDDDDEDNDNSSNPDDYDDDGDDE